MFTVDFYSKIMGMIDMNVQMVGSFSPMHRYLAAVDKMKEEGEEGSEEVWLDKLFVLNHNTSKGFGGVTFS